MKNKLIAVLALASASLFAFAEAPAENAAPEKAKCCRTQCCDKGGKCAKQDKCDKKSCDKESKCAKGPQARPRFLVKHMLLSLDDEALAKLADEIAAVRAMTPEQRAEALAKLPKPEFRGAPRGERPDCGRSDAPRREKCESCGDKPGKEAHGPHAHAPRGDRPAKGMRGPKGKGPAEGEALPPPAEEAVAE
ncbi:MAG: hypothetical protein ACI4QA_05780 [Candidatus Spyradosoma sp.]